jgi:hypothetical protein
MIDERDDNSGGVGESLAAFRHGPALRMTAMAVASVGSLSTLASGCSKWLAKLRSSRAEW